MLQKKNSKCLKINNLSNYNILVITAIKHIESLKIKLKKFSKITFLDDPTYAQVIKVIHKYDIIFTNPNKSKVLINKKLIKKAKKLKCVVTASTGVNHIDTKYLTLKKIKLISLTKDFFIIRKISSTAEHALALTMCQVRNVVPASKSVRNGNWDYTKFIGRQFNGLKIGVVGYGRLGAKYSSYVLALKSKIFAYEPFKKIKNKKIKQVKTLKFLFQKCDIISIHVHVSKDTLNMINKTIFQYAKKDLLLVNTSRGEIINELDLINFLKKNKKSKYAADVISNEINNKNKSKILKFSKNNDQVLITPHIGGMTKEAQSIAYERVLDKLIEYAKYKK